VLELEGLELGSERVEVGGRRGALFDKHRSGVQLIDELALGELDGLGCLGGLRARLGGGGFRSAGLLGLRLGGRLGPSGDTGIQPTLLAVGGILVDDTSLGSLVERGSKGAVEGLHIGDTGLKGGTKLFLLSLETAQDAAVAGLTLDGLTLAFEIGVALLGGCFGGGHGKGVGWVFGI
jgi:hypothetical protein